MECLVNGTVSRPGDKCVTADMKDYYYDTILAYYRYMCLSTGIIPDKVIT